MCKAVKVKGSYLRILISGTTFFQLKADFWRDSIAHHRFPYWTAETPVIAEFGHIHPFQASGFMRKQYRNKSFGDLVIFTEWRHPVAGGDGDGDGTTTDRRTMDFHKRRNDH